MLFSFDLDYPDEGEVGANVPALAEKHNVTIVGTKDGYSRKYLAEAPSHAVALVFLDEVLEVPGMGEEIIQVED